MNDVTTSAVSTPITVTLTVQGVPLQLELDTGASVSIIRGNLFKRFPWHAPRRRYSSAAHIRRRAYRAGRSGKRHCGIQHKRHVLPSTLYSMKAHHVLDEIGYRSSSSTGQASMSCMSSRRRYKPPGSCLQNSRHFSRSSHLFSDELGTIQCEKVQFLFKDNQEP